MTGRGAPERPVARAPEPTGAYLRQLLGTRFTDEQLAVAIAPLQPLLVIAGAGSGKTTVMAARLVHAIACHGVAPSAVLGLTFTNKAAGELSSKVRRALERLPSTALGGDDEPVIATYHAYSAALVRDHALRIGRESRTSLLTEATRWQLAARVVSRSRHSFRHLRWELAYTVRQVLALDAEMAEHRVAPDLVRAVDARLIAGGVETEDKAARECAETALTRDELLVLVEAYRATKRESDLLDFGDQVSLAADIVEQAPEVGALERDRFALLLLDEYQDTGVAQRQILTALFGGGHPVTAVGDMHQAIYGWRGASVGNLVRFGEHFPLRDGAPAPVLPLMTSFRCGGQILALANRIAAPLRAPAPHRRGAAPEVPELAAPAEAAGKGATVLALHATVRQEAEWVAAQVAAAVAAGTPPAEVGVLARTRGMFPLLHAALVAAGLPVEVVGLGGLLDMPEVADVVATLQVLADPTANPALLRLLTGSRWRIGPQDLAALGRQARQLARTEWPPGPTDPLAAAAAGSDPVEIAALADALDGPGDPHNYSAAAYHRFRLLSAELHDLRRLLETPVVDLVAEVVSRSGLDVEVEAAPEPVAAARAANLAAFADAAASFTSIDGASDLPAFLAYLDAAADAENGLDPGGVSAADTVKLLTVHKAKGLEWDVVAVPGLVTRSFPSGQSRPVWTTGASVLPAELRGDAIDLPVLSAVDAKAVAAYRKDWQASEADEERRLAYVAITRARRRLLLSGYWWGETQLRCKGPSAFLLELAATASSGLVEVDHWVAEEEAPSANPALDTADRDVAWPYPGDPAAAAVRSAAADLVRGAAKGSAPASDAPVAAGKQPEKIEQVEAAQALELEQVKVWRSEAASLLAELRQAGHPQRDVRLPRRLTTSQVVQLGTDPDGLARSLARPVPVRPGAAARRGTRFHAWVQQHYGERTLLDLDDLPGAADAGRSDDDLAELQRRFLASGFADRCPVAIEAPFQLVVGERLLRGRMDAVYPRADGGYDVIDFKTGTVPPDIAAASVQLSIYRLAWADLAGVDIDAVGAGFFYVRTGTLLRPDRLLSLTELSARIDSESATTGVLP